MNACNHCVMVSCTRPSSPIVIVRRIASLRLTICLTTDQIDPYIDTTLHNIHKSPLSFKYLDCYGYLGKFSPRRKVWRHRYFILKDACLYFYSDANSNTALGKTRSSNICHSEQASHMSNEWQIRSDQHLFVPIVTINI